MIKMVIVRGLPGSGKSTLAEDLCYSPDWKHLEADMFWMQDGEYKFDASKLPKAHEWCRENTSRSLEQGLSVVVSNTFTTIKELQPYFEIAKKFNIVPQVITCHAQYGNVHNVPEETLARMKARFVYDLTELYNDNMGNK